MTTNSKPSKSLSKSYISAVGRRKTAIARVRLFSKSGDILVNDQPINKYFPGQASKLKYEQALKLTETHGKVSATIKVKGGGKEGQLDAVVHGLARALVKADEKYRPILRSKGLMTRDERMRERRKVGTGGKARRQKQSPKR